MSSTDLIFPNQIANDEFIFINPVTADGYDISRLALRQVPDIDQSDSIRLANYLSQQQSFLSGIQIQIDLAIEDYKFWIEKFLKLDDDQYINLPFEEFSKNNFQYRINRMYGFLGELLVATKGIEPYETIKTIVDGFIEVNREYINYLTNTTINFSDPSLSNEIGSNYDPARTNRITLTNLLADWNSVVLSDSQTNPLLPYPRFLDGQSFPPNRYISQNNANQFLIANTIKRNQIILSENPL